MNIYQRLQAVMQKVSYVQKDAEVTGGGSYRAVTHDMVTAIVRPHFVQNGIITVPRLMSCGVVDTGRQTKGGTPIIRYEGLYEVSFVNMDDPTDCVTIPVSAHAEDQGDKAPGKALSYATKYAILKVLMLESGDSDEGRIKYDVEPLSEDEIDGIKSRLNKATDRANLRERLKEAFSVIAKAGDKEAHETIKAYASTLALNLPETAKAA